MYRSTFFLTSALVGSEWSASRPGRFIPMEKVPGTHWRGGWVDLIAGLDDVEKRKFLTLPGLELRPLCCPVRKLVAIPTTLPLLTKLYVKILKYVLKFLVVVSRSKYCSLPHISNSSFTNIDALYRLNY
jgi:hypothetical protein